MKNYEKMWSELKSRIDGLMDDDGLIIESDLLDVMEELENEYEILIFRPKAINSTESPSDSGSRIGGSYE